jgi:hypothetical protein
MNKECARRQARTRFVVLTAAGIATLLFLLPLSFQAVPGDSLQALCAGAASTASD